MKTVKYKFTLAEILVAMAVFSILLTLMLQFFSGARTLWTANEKRASVYADASIALDLMANLLQTTYLNRKEPVLAAGGGTPVPPENQTPFLIKRDSAAPANSGSNDRIFFISELPGGSLLSGGAIRFLSFQRGDDPDNTGKNNVLYLKVLCDAEGLDFSSCNDLASLDKDDSKFSKEHDGTLSGDKRVQKFLYDLMTKHSEFKLQAGGGSSDDHKRRVKPVLRNVTGLKFIPIYLEGSDIKKYTENDDTGIYSAAAGKTLVGIEIELSLMPSEAVVDDWASKNFDNDFRISNEFTFRRTVWLGHRMYIR